MLEWKIRKTLIREMQPPFQRKDSRRKGAKLTPKCECRSNFLTHLDSPLFIFQIGIVFLEFVVLLNVGELLVSDI